jgi:ParB family chromosome partitioning protein
MRLPLARIRPPGHQLRASIDPQALGELADSMATEGLHQPIGCRGPDAAGDYEIVWGHRRLLAAGLLLWADIPARVFPASYDPLLAAVSENLQRADLNPLEEATACLRFVERGVAVPAIARLFRRSDVWVRDRLALLELPDDLRAVVAERTLPLAVVRVLADVDHDGYRQELLREAVRSGISATTAEVWRAHFFAERERLVKNLATVEEIASARASFVISYPCEWCDAMTAFEHTTSWRLCGSCNGELRHAKARALQTT